MVICQEVLQSHAKLVQISNALNIPRSRSRLTHCGKQQGHKNCDDANYNQHFD